MTGGTIELLRTVLANYYSGVGISTGAMHERSEVRETLDSLARHWVDIFEFISDSIIALLFVACLLSVVWLLCFSLPATWQPSVIYFCFTFLFVVGSGFIVGSAFKACRKYGRYYKLDAYVLFLISRLRGRINPHRAE